MLKVTGINFICHALHSSAKRKVYFAAFLNMNAEVDLVKPKDMTKMRSR